MEPFDPETIDLAELARSLRNAVGPTVEGIVVGRTLLRDEVIRLLECSLLEAEQLVDTMIGRGIIRQGELSDGRDGFHIETP